MTIFNSKYKRAGSDLYKIIGEIYILISDELKKIDELKEEIDNDESFSNELLFILFFFSTVQLQKYFDNKVVTERIFNSVHNCYFTDLGNNIIGSNSGLQNIRNILNLKYSSYFKLYTNENMLLDISGEFLRNIKSKQTNNLDVIIPLSFWFVKANKLLNDAVKIIDSEYKIS